MDPLWAVSILLGYLEQAFLYFITLVFILAFVILCIAGWCLVLVATWSLFDWIFTCFDYTLLRMKKEIRKLKEESSVDV